MKKITGVTVWVGSIDDDLKNPTLADIGLTINRRQYRRLLECLETGADISIRLTPRGAPE